MKKATEKKMTAFESAYQKMYESNLKTLKQIEKVLKKQKSQTPNISWANVGDMVRIDEMLTDILTNLL